MNKAVLVGINDYQNAPLNGCVPDIKACCAELVGGFNWQWQDLRSCTDRRATRDGIIKRIEWLCDGARAGDVLLFWYSGHGAQIPIRGEEIGNEVDGLREVLCPVDFDIDDPETWIDDRLFERTIKPAPGVNLTIVLDSCFSGGMIPTNGARKRDSEFERNRSYPIRINAAREMRISSRPIVSRRLKAKAAYIALCQEDQTCADAYISDAVGYMGAGSFFLWKSILSMRRNTLSEIVADTAKRLKESRFSQVPKLEGPEAITQHGFLEIIPS
jgi:hypothetical protein